MKRFSLEIRLREVEFVICPTKHAIVESLELHDTHVYSAVMLNKIVGLAAFEEAVRAIKELEA